MMSLFLGYLRDAYGGPESGISEAFISFRTAKSGGIVCASKTLCLTCCSLKGSNEDKWHCLLLGLFMHV